MMYILFLALIACLFGTSWCQSLMPAAVDGSSRSNWAALRQAVLLKKTNFTTALFGTTITVGVDPTGSPDPLFLTFDPTTKYPNGGHIYTTLTSVATFMGCKLNWLQLPSQGTMSNDDYVAASVKLVDIFGAFYVTERSDYLENGITTTYMALSNSMILVTSTEKPHPKSWWNFGIPYSNDMWLCIFFVMVFQGFCQVAIIKRKEYDPDEGVYAKHSCIHNLFNAINSFAGEKTEFTQGFAFMTMVTALNFFMFILTSSYLANLSSVLYNESIPPPPYVINAESANTNYQTLCVRESPISAINTNGANSNANYINGILPLINILRKPYPDYLTSVGDDCSGAFVGKADWLYNKGLNAVNADDLLFNKPLADPIDIRSMLLSDSYRFATALDYNNKYTNFMTQIFSMALGTVHQTGSIQGDYEATITRLQDFPTKWDTADPTSNKLSLAITDMIGIFIVFASGCGLATVLFFWGKCYDRYLRTHVDQQMIALSSRLPARFRSSNGHREEPISSESIDVYDNREDMIPPPINPQLPIDPSFFPTRNEMDDRFTIRKRSGSLKSNEGASYF